mgnify:CR=1 FL=1
MRAVIQRVSRASVKVEDTIAGSIEKGFVVLLGVEEGDTQQDIAYICQKIAHIRVFEDDARKMNLGLADVDGELLIVSQFTLLGDARKGRRPGFTAAAKPELANAYYEAVCADLRAQGFKVEQGVFQTDMQVEIINDGPVTILLDSRKLF